MSSKFERDLLLPVHLIIQKAIALEKDAGTDYRLGFQQSAGDRVFAGIAAKLGDVMDANDHDLAHSMIRWYEGGCPRFRLSHGLTTHLALTDPVGVAMAEIRQPFPTYIVELPHPSGPVVWNGKSDDDFGIREPKYLVVHTGMVGGDAPLSQVAEGMPYAEMHKVLASCRAQESRPEIMALLFSGFTYQMDTLRLFQALDSDHVKPPAPSPRNDANAVYDDSALTMAWRISFNLPLYLKHRPSLETSSGKTVNHDHGMRSTLYELGADVPLNRDLRDAARAACSGQHGAKAWALAQRFIVRGHWKMQAHGPGHSERKMIFVEPYWKGSADTPLVTRAYVDRPYDGEGA